MKKEDSKEKLEKTQNSVLNPISQPQLTASIPILEPDVKVNSFVI